MNRVFTRMLALAAIAGITCSIAATDHLSTKQYVIVTGDFNGDGRADLLLQSRDDGISSGTVFADASGTLPQFRQTWSAGYLGIDWNPNNTEIITGDFNGDGRADLLLRSKTRGGQTHLLLADTSGQFTAVSQSWSNGYLGYDWDGTVAQAIVGDFNGDGRDDLFLQSNFESGTHAVFLADATGQFTAPPTQTIANDFLGLRWSHVFHEIHAGDINGDGRDDLVLQVRQSVVVLPLDDDFSVIPILPSIHNVSLLADASGHFSAIYQQWDAHYLGLDWVGQNSDLTLADFDGDGRADILLRPRNGSTNQLLRASASGTFDAVSDTFDNNQLGLNWSNTVTKLVIADFNGDHRADFLLQSTSPANPSALALADSLGKPGTILQADVQAEFQSGFVTKTGATAGSFAVSPSGEATYTIPIVVAPGTNGMQPNLSLVYSSQAGNGLMGIGWSLAGFSVVHRCGATIEIEGFRGGVNYDGSDRFCLDGERLVLLPGSSTEYRTFRESLQRVVASGPTGNPSSFTVTDKNGTIREYSVAIDAATKPGVHRLWALSKVKDAHGNYFTITYDASDVAASGDYRPISIAYTANDNAGTTPTQSVVLTYSSNRTDVTPVFEAGSVIKTLKLLTGVTSYAGNTKVREYRLGYDSGGTLGRMRLTSVQECGTDTVCYAPTVFQWQADAQPQAFSVGTVPGFGTHGFWGDSNNQTTLSGDFNGDGKTDILNVQSDGNDWLALSVGDGSFTFVDAPTGLEGWQFSPDKTSETLLTGDFNGDGKTDVVNLQSDGNHWLALSNGDGSFVHIDSPSGLEGAQFWAGNSEHKIVPGDFNGDGKTDLLNLQSDGNDWLAISNGDGSFTFIGQPAGVEGKAYWEDYNNQTIVPGDFNGDGKTDVLNLQSDGNDWLALSKGDGSFEFFNTVSGLEGWQFDPGVDAHEIIPGDFNGDGKTDVLNLQSDGNHWLGLSNGDGSFTVFGQPPGLEGVGFWPDNNNQTIITGDFNSDGKIDVLNMQSDGNEWLALSKGDGSFLYYDAPTGLEGRGYWADSNNQTIVGGDFNGDGKTDVFNLQSDGNDWIAQRIGPHPDVLASIVNGLGVTTDITYLPLSDSDSGIYTKDTDPNPVNYQDVQDATYVVSAVSMSNAVGGSNTTGYHYEGLKRHLTASVSLGFRRVESTDPAGVVHRTDYNQDREAGIDGTVAEDGVLAAGVWVKHTSYTWVSVANVCNGMSQPQLQGSVEESRELTGELVSRVNITNEYDACGFPSNIVTDYNDGWRKTVINTYQNDTTNWILGRVTQAQVTAEAPGQAPQTRTSRFTYRADGLLQSEVIEPDKSALTLTTVYDYDAFGNRIGKTVSGPDIATRNQTQYFDPALQGRFATVTTDALGHETHDEYDPRNGQVTKHTDPNGLVTTSAYDGFGRKMQETRPDGTQSAISFRATPEGYAMLVASEGTSDVETFYDMLGREIKKTIQGFGDTLIYKSIRYDALGRVEFKSQPEFNAPSAQGVTYVYDLLNRVTSVTTPGPGNRTTTSAYNGLVTTVTNPLGQQTVTTKNSQGKPTEVRDNAGNTTAYVYDAFANLLSVTDAAGNVTSMTYDDRGRKIGMHDPDMGAWSYTYDVLGELTSQTDAKGQQTTMAHDLLGRMTSRVIPANGGTTTSTWTYDTAAMGIGRLASLTDTQGYVETHTYDSVGRPSQTTTRIGGTDYPVTRGYDQFGRLTTITYPSGYTVKQVYDASGHLWMVYQLKSDGTQKLIWETDTADAHGRITREIYGNGVVSARAYDPETNNLQTIQTSSGGSTNNIQDLSYTFDALGNLKTRNDTAPGVNLNETFTYDSLNRLTQATGAVTKSYQYDSIGNLTYKSDVGSYTYPASGATSVRPHAVISVAGSVNASYGYDANGNMTSRAGNAITYTAFNKPETVTGPNGTTTLTYDPAYHRIQKSTSAGTISYVGKLFEHDVTGTLVEDKHYIYAGGSLVALYTSRNNYTADTQYFHTDHLGSINVVTDDSANIVERLSFDPHGQRRQPNGQDASGITSKFRRGFTGHEMDDEVGLINMNARLYDPLLGRFITPDSMGEGPAGQGLNRYSYVRNNPLSLADPTGNFSLKRLFRSIVRVHVAVFKAMHSRAAIGATALVLAPYLGPVVTAQFGAIGAGALQGGLLGYVAGGDLRSVLTGAAGGALFGWVGNFHLIGVSQVAAHATAGGAFSVLTGGDLRSGILGGGFGALVGNIPALNKFPGRVIAGGIAAEIGGGEFGNGALTAAYGYLFNEAAHAGAGAGAGVGEAAGTSLLSRFIRAIASPFGWALTLSGDTPQGDLYMHYGYAADEGSFAQGLRPGGYATEYGPPMTGAQAQQLLALPHAAPPDAYYVVRIVPSGSVPVVGPLTVSGTDVPPRTGGGAEYRFPQGTPPGSVMGPFPLPR